MDDKKLLDIIEKLKVDPKSIAERLLSVQPLGKETGDAIKTLCDNDWVITFKMKEQDDNKIR